MVLQRCSMFQTFLMAQEEGAPSNSAEVLQLVIWWHGGTAGGQPWFVSPFTSLSQLFTDWDELYLSSTKTVSWDSLDRKAL